MSIDTNQKVFFELLRAGLWEKEVRLAQYKAIDFAIIMRLAEEQSVVGLVTAGLEQVKDTKIPQEWTLQFIGATLQIEQRNKAMNDYVAKLIEHLRSFDIYTLLVKGQGISQCYERPFWRASGDVDLLLSSENYEKAKGILVLQALDVEKEYKSFKHLGMTMQGGYMVELHGTFHGRLSKRVDRVIDEAQNRALYLGEVRSWINGQTSIFLPSPDNDVIFVFTHILHHYYIEGVGLRQICDWCRLLWTYRESLNRKRLESEIKEAGLMSEWKAFAALAVEWLGMPAEAIPLYSSDKKWSQKDKRILSFILESGNFGHNRYVSKGKISAIWQKTKDFARHATVFPWDSIKFYIHFVRDGLRIATDK